MAAPAAGQNLQEPARTRFESPLLTTDRTLQASLKRIWRGSSLWRSALETVHKSGRQALVVTLTDAMVTVASQGRRGTALDPGVLAEVVPVVGERLQVPLVIVVVNLRLIRDAHDARLSALRDFEADLDRILVHEIYGHAMPYLLAGDLSGRCADPRAGEAASESCSIRRENAVRAQLGLGRRADPGVFSLALALGMR